METPSKSYAKETVRLSTGRDPEALLRELYIDRRHSQQEIADALGITRSLVKKWLAEYGITRDERPPVAL
jgi:DNA invertase Pin-like site-specific DNA recombinase